VSEEYIEANKEHILFVTKTVRNSVDWLHYKSENLKRYSNMCIVKAESLELLGPNFTKIWDNVVLRIYWKATHQVVKVQISRIYKLLRPEYRSLVAWHVAQLARAPLKSDPACGVSIDFTPAMKRDFVHIGV